MKFYLASGFFTNKQREHAQFVANMYKKMLQEGDELYVPMEHTIPNAWDLPNKEWGKQVFEMDLKALDEADIVLYIDYGYQGDCGASWEVGYAYAKGKTIKTFLPVNLTDKPHIVSLMIANSTIMPLDKNNTIYEEK